MTKHAVASLADKHLKATLGITDAKSLYDSVKREAKSKEWRVALAVSEMKQSMAIVDAGIRWIPHNLMLSDPLPRSSKSQTCLH